MIRRKPSPTKLTLIKPWLGAAQNIPPYKAGSQGAVLAGEGVMLAPGGRQMPHYVVNKALCLTSDHSGWYNR